MKLSVIARDSRLSQLQVKEAMLKFPELDYRLRMLSSFGDKHRQISLLDGEAPPDMFTRELDDALISGEADIAIHSAKDLPYPLDERLEVIALFPPFDQTDSLVSRGHVTLSGLPAGSRVGTSSPMRKKGIQALRPDLDVVGIRGCIEERVAQVHDGSFDAAIIATCALKRLGLEHEIAEVLPFDTHPLQGYLAVTALKGRDDLRELFQREDVLHLQGAVTLVGFGPGDPDLLTVKAVKALRQADVIFYDALIDQRFLQEFKAEKVFVGKRSGRHHVEQNEINRLMLAASREGKRTVRLKGGDPMLFGHAGEEIEYLQSNLVEVSVVPGITAASALAASAKVSLTYRGISSGVAFLNGHSATPAIADTETAVYYMGGSNLQRIGQSLQEGGWPSSAPVLLAHNLSMDDEQLFETTVGQLGTQTYPTPLLVMAGDVTSLRHRAAVSVKRTLFTGIRCTNPHYIHTPMIEVHPVNYESPDANAYDYILFTSRHAVQFWFSKNPIAGHPSVISIGPVTSEALKEAGVVIFVQVDHDDSYGVLEYFQSQQRGKVLIPRSDIALPIIPDGLRELGYAVDTLTVYQTVYPNRVRKVNLSNIHRVVFTSPSTVTNFIKTYGELPAHIEYVCRGKVTESYLRGYL